MRTRFKRHKLAPEPPNAIEAAFSRLSAESREDAKRRLAFDTWIDESVCPVINVMLGRLAMNAPTSKADQVYTKRLDGSVGAYVSRYGIGVLAISRHCGFGRALADRYEPEGYQVQFSDPAEIAPNQEMSVLISLPDISPYITEVESLGGQVEV